jgi:hypothetical protein
VALVGRGNKALLILDFGARCGWEISVTPRSRFSPGGERTPSTHWTGGWVRPRAGLDTEARGKILSPVPGNEPRSPGHPAVAIHYTDWATRLTEICPSTHYFISDMHRWGKDRIICAQRTLYYFNRNYICIRDKGCVQTSTRHAGDTTQAAERTNTSTFGCKNTRKTKRWKNFVELVFIAQTCTSLTDFY